MSYSRWGSSTWYTFWSASSAQTHFKWPTRKIKRGQHFEICDIPSYTVTYGDLEDKGINQIILEIREFYNKSHEGQLFTKWEDGEAAYEDSVYPPKNPTEEELLELYGYILKWKGDVDKRFKFWEYIKWEWWYMLRSRFYWKVSSKILNLFKKSK